MNQIIEHLKESIRDEVFSKSERKSLKAILAEAPLDQNQLNFLRSKMYEIAKENVTEKNYPFILEWIRNVNNTLLNLPEEESSSAFFSPGDACRNTIISQVNRAIKTIKICVFTISDDQITDSLITAHKRGTNVNVITDNDKSSDMGSDIRQIARVGIPVKMDSTPNHMHHKFMIVDEHTLVTGSYNWTNSAARYNHENILLTKSAGVVKSYLKEFSQLWKVMIPYQ